MSKRTSSKNKGIKAFNLIIVLIIGFLVILGSAGKLDKYLNKYGITIPNEYKVLSKYFDSKDSNINELSNQKEDFSYKVGVEDFIPPVKQVGLRGDSTYPDTDNSYSKSNIKYKIVNNPNNYAKGEVISDKLDRNGSLAKASVIKYKGNILEVPMYDGYNRVVVVNDNKTDFTLDELNQTSPYKRISPQDDVLDTENPHKNKTKSTGKDEVFGRTLDNEVVVNREVLPNQSRGGLKTEPTGWRQLMVDNKAQYDRGHVIAYSLSAEDDNPLNLTTQTAQTNKGMGIFSFTYYENLVRESVKMGNTIRYRVVPMYYENELVPRAYQLEAKTVALAGDKETGNNLDGKSKVIDSQDNMEFNVVVYNVQDTVSINYLTGELSELK